MALMIENELSIETKEGLVAYLERFVTPQRRDLIQKNIELRTRHIAVMLENIYQPHNASAVLRSCDCFGVQDAYIIEDINEYRINPEVAMGATKWLTLHRFQSLEFNSTARCLERMKEAGYTIAATTLRPGAVMLPEISIEQKLVLCFGTEEDGLSDYVHEQADLYLQIPMYGFTQSYNISVSAALCLYELTKRLRQPTANIEWQLSTEERLDLLVDWLVKATTHGKALARQYFRDNDAEIPERFIEEEEEDEE